MSNNETQNKMVTKSQNFKVTNVTNDGRDGADYMFEITVNDRWYFSVTAEVLDTNREELEITIVNIGGVEGEFEPKLRYEAEILDKLGDHCEADDETFRDSPEDWAEYYAELNADAARYM